MELTTLLPYMGILLCPIAMGLMMWMMSRNMGGHVDQAPLGQTPTERLDVLREQRKALEAEISEMTRIKELEQERTLATQPTGPSAADNAIVPG